MDRKQLIPVERFKPWKWYFFNILREMKTLREIEKNTLTRFRTNTTQNEMLNEAYEIYKHGMNLVGKEIPDYSKNKIGQIVLDVVNAYTVGYYGADAPSEMMVQTVQARHAPWLGYEANKLFLTMDLVQLAYLLHIANTDEENINQQLGIMYQAHLVNYGQNINAFERKFISDLVKTVGEDIQKGEFGCGHLK